MARPDLPLQPQPQPQSSLPEAQPKASKALPIAALIVRVITKISLLVSLTVLTSNSATLKNEYGEVKFRFRQVYAYRYVVSVVVIGMTYTFLQIPFSINRVTTAKRLPDNDGLLNFDFIGDKVLLCLLATGVGAAFGATFDLKKKLDQIDDVLMGSNDYGLSQIRAKLDNFFNMAYVSACFLLIAFFCSGASSVISSLALSKKR